MIGCPSTRICVYGPSRPSSRICEKLQFWQLLSTRTPVVYSTASASVRADRLLIISCPTTSVRTGTSSNRRLVRVPVTTTS